MNFKALGIGLGLIVALGACAGMASCAIVTTPVVEVRAVSYEHKDEFYCFNSDLLPNTGYFEFALQPNMSISVDGHYVLAGCNIGMDYFIDPLYPELTEFVVTSITPVIRRYSLGALNLSPTLFAWQLQTYSDHCVAVCAGSSSSNAPYSVPISFYKKLYSSSIYTALTTYDTAPAVIAYKNTDMQASNFAIGVGISSYFAQNYAQLMYEYVDLLEGNLIDYLSFANDVWNDEMTDYGQERYDEGLRYGYREGQASVSNETTAINTLFGTMWNVPMNVLNGLTPLAIWNTPIISIIFTFLGLGILFFIIGRLFK